MKVKRSSTEMADRLEGPSRAASPVTRASTASQPRARLKLLAMCIASARRGEAAAARKTAMTTASLPTASQIQALARQRSSHAATSSDAGT